MSHLSHLRDKQLIGYVQHALSDAQRETMNQHLAYCPRCRTCLAEMETLHHHIQNHLRADIQRAKPSAAMTYTRVDTRIARRSGFMTFWGQAFQMLSTMASVALIVALSVALIALFDSMSHRDTFTASAFNEMAIKDRSITDTEIVSWMRNSAHAIQSIQPYDGDDYSDLMFLKDMIGDARIVALGEGTYGTHEFATMKHRIVRFLVEEMDFNMVAMEVPWPIAVEMNKYIIDGKGSPQVPLSEVESRTWNTKETLDMIEWMRAYNISSSVSFHGFDIRSPYHASINVLGYFLTVEQDYYETAWGQLECIISSHFSSYYIQLSETFQDECRIGIQTVLNHLLDNEQRYIERSSPSDYASAVHNTQVLVWAEEYHSQTSEIAADALRDRVMAEQVKWILDQAAPDAKLIIWAHNDHIADQTQGSVKRMGRYLRAQYGDDLVTFGFAFNAGSVFTHYQEPTNSSAVNTPYSNDNGTDGNFRVPAAPYGSFEWYAHSTRIPAFMLDLREATWLAQSSLMRSIQDNYQQYAPQEHFKVYDLAQAFDALIYIDQTTPIKRLDKSY